MRQNFYLIRSIFAKCLCSFLIFFNTLQVFDPTEAFEMQTATEYKNFCSANNMANLPYDTRSTSQQLTINGNVYNFILQRPNTDTINEQKIKEVFTERQQNSKNISQTDCNPDLSWNSSNESLNKLLGRTVSDTIFINSEKKLENKSQLSKYEYIKLMQNTMCNNNVPRKSHNEYTPTTMEISHVIADVFSKVLGGFIPN